MRAAFCSLVVFVGSLHGQQAAAPKEGTAAPGETRPKEESLSGGVTGAAKPDLDAKPLRPSKMASPSPSAFPTQYLLYVAEAMKSFQARDFDGALVYAERADALMPPTIWTLNVRGAVAIERLDFVVGEKYCRDALKMDPNFFPAQFNLSEIPFLQRKYSLARQGWEGLYNGMAPDDATIELLAYRIFLTYLLEGDMKQAKEWLQKLPFPSQTPAYQYANAAWERQNGNMTKWKEWNESAEFIWPLSKRSSFSDVLYQLKWLQKEDFSSTK